jgi:hypothetical protein
LAAEHLVFGIEQRIFLQAAPVQGSGAKRQNPGACLVGTFESKLDLALERQNATPFAP